MPGHVRRFVVVVALIVAALAIATPRAYATPPQSVGAATPSASGVETACTVLNLPGVDDVTDELLGVLTRGRYRGGLASWLVVNYVQTNCESLLPKAITAVQGFLGSEPQRYPVASLATFRSSLPALTTSSLIAGILKPRFPNISGTQVETLATNFCNDVTGYRRSTVVDDLHAVLNGATLQDLRGVNQITSLVVNRCGRLTPYQADGLVSQTTNYLIVNQFRALDVTPPIVVGPTWARTAVPTTITLEWDAFDLFGGDVASYDVWVKLDGRWISLFPETANTEGAIDNILRSRSYLFAVRAVDTAGNASGWAYMSPCLTCA